MRNHSPFVFAALSLFALVLSSGCANLPRQKKIIPVQAPVELNKVTHPEYIIEAPDVLQITAIQATPRQPYKLQATDTLAVTVQNALADAPIAGLYTVELDGEVNLGPRYTTVKVIDLTAEEAQKVIDKALIEKVGLIKPESSVRVTQTRAIQQIAGEHLVRADGTVYLGTYGSVRLTGLTLSDARKQVETHLAAYLHKPQITLDVLAYNSKVLYVIFDGAGVGQQVTRLPVTGNETVLDAISKVNGLGQVSDQNQIWVARPALPSCGADQILPVDWVGITTKGQTATNYQLLPGDRLFVKAYRATILDQTIARVFAPVERILGVTLLGASTYQQLKNVNTVGNNLGGGGFRP